MKLLFLRRKTHYEKAYRNGYGRCHVRRTAGRLRRRCIFCRRHCFNRLYRYRGSSAATTEAADGLNYSKLTVGTDGTDLTASLKILTQRTDLIEDGTFDKYISEFNAIYPNISIKYEGMTDYANDMTTRLTSNDWGDICMVPTTIPLTELGDYFEPLCSVSDI